MAIYEQTLTPCLSIASTRLRPVCLSCLKRQYMSVSVENIRKLTKIITQMWINVSVFIIRAGFHQVPRDTILSRYFAYDKNDITTQRFCDNRYIANNFSQDTSWYLCHWRNSEFIDCTESISQELQNIVNQFHMNDSQVNKEYIAQWLFLSHTLTTTIIKYRYVWVPGCLNHFFNFIWLYTYFWIKIKCWWWWAKKKRYYFLFIFYIFKYRYLAPVYW